MPVEHQRGKITEWQHTFSFTTKEKEYIEKHMKQHGLTFNGAIRKILIEYGKIKGWI